ncbi:TPA: AAA family ATPase [Vibrio vulnificus]|nr:AAA family ATPase [Vibrio vulnificus]
MKLLENFKIFNLWNREEISIDLHSQVTFLSGYNGSGKSTILNILFDTLSSEFYGTSKQRFWTCTANFSDKTSISRACLPYSSHSIDIANNIDDYIIEDDLYSYASIKNVEQNFAEKLENQKYNLYNSKECGVLSIQSHEFNFEPFLFQDERRCMHNISNTNIDFDSQYWGKYGIELDQKLIYVLDKLQIYEAKTNKLLTEELFSLSKKSTKREMFNLIEKHESSRKDLKKLTRTLNSYFIQLGKIICKDESERLELEVIGTKERIHWYNLSRGEKTLMYLFLVTFLYRDSTSIFIFDEPDIAIHIEWQESLVKHLLEMAPNCQFLIATHSPALVMNGWLDNVISLKMV